MKTLFLALLILITPVMAWPHPGKTDSVGGHKCYKSCEKWELLFGEYHLHDKYGKPVRVARKVKKERSIVAEPPAAPVQEEQVEMQQPIQAAAIPSGAGRSAGKGPLDQSFCAASSGFAFAAAPDKTQGAGTAVKTVMQR